MDAKPSQALRKGRWQSSMWLALEAVKDGRADAAVSAGNTGALMAMAKFCLKTLARRRSPGHCRHLADRRGECIVLDVGANVGADARQLVEFALMGAAMARALFGIDKPSVGLLNIGVEEVKGLDEIREGRRRARKRRRCPFAITASSKATMWATASSTSSSPTALPATSP